MGEYTEGIERINIELSLRNKLALVDALEAFFDAGNLPLGKSDDAGAIATRRAARGPRAAGARAAARGRARSGALARRPRPARRRVDRGTTVFELLQDHTLRASWKTQIRAPLREHLRRRGAVSPIVDACQRIHGEVLRGRVWVALHMHAGDGNVHTNIPVNSDNYEMLQTAHEAVARIMALARSLGRRDLGRARHRHHQARVPHRRRARRFTAYKQRVDPEGRFNKGKLLRDASVGRRALKADLTNAYTPSFGLMGHESLIMQQSDIGEIADSIKDCLRCGKCKPACATHVPRANLLYSPRNKILATSLLIEAFLYEEQTRRGVSIRHWEEFEDVADHCTVCHKCLAPCPVDIDFGDVSMNMRNLLRKMGQKSFAPGRRRRRCCSSTRPARRRSRSCARRWSTSASRRSAPPTTCCAASPTRRPRHRRPTVGPAAAQGAGDPLRQQEDAGRPAEAAPRARCSTSRTRTTCRSSAIPKTHDRGDRGGLLLPRLRLGAAVLAGRPGDAGDALARRRADGAAAGLPVLRLPAARRRRLRQGREDHHRQPGALPPRRQHAQLPRHQDRRGQLRHLLRPAAGLRVRARSSRAARIIDIHEFLLEKGITLGAATGPTRLPLPRPVPQPDEAAASRWRR